MCGMEAVEGGRRELGPAVPEDDLSLCHPSSSVSPPSIHSPRSIHSYTLRRTGSNAKAAMRRRGSFGLETMRDA